MMPDVVAASPPVTRPAPGSRAPGINFHFITAAAVICISSSSSSRLSAQSSLSPDVSCLVSPSCLSVSPTIAIFVPYCFLALYLHVGLGHLNLDRVFLGAACYSRTWDHHSWVTIQIESPVVSAYYNFLVLVFCVTAAVDINTWNLLFVTTNISLMTPLSNAGVIILGLFNLIYSIGALVLSMVGRRRSWRHSSVWRQGAGWWCHVLLGILSPCPPLFVVQPRTFCPPLSMSTRLSPPLEINTKYRGEN